MGKLASTLGEPRQVICSKPSRGKAVRELFPRIGRVVPRAHARRQPTVITVRPAIFDRDVLALDIACSFRPSENAATRFAFVPDDPLSRKPITGIADCCARAASGQAMAPPAAAINSRRFMDRPRPRGASHSTTSSARAITVPGMVMPSDFAVLRLTANSKTVGNCTGRSAGLAPFKMRST
jgi:hypothetical protein